MRSHQAKWSALAAALLLVTTSGLARAYDAGHAGEAAAGCLLQSTAAESGGWYRGPVDVDCTPLRLEEGAEGIEYSLDFGDWMSSPGNFTLSQDGSHWVQVRSISAGGAVGLPRTMLISIDTAAPSIWWIPPAEKLSHADQLWPDVSAQDDLSGVAAIAVEVDAEQEIVLGVPLELWRLPLGKHTLTVYARDYAGNVAYTADPFVVEVTVDKGALERLVRMFAAQGQLDSTMGLDQRLLAHLQKAQQATDGAIEQNALAAFVEEVRQGMADGALFAEAGAVLESDALALLNGQNQDPSTQPPDWAQH